MLALRPLGLISGFIVAKVANVPLDTTCTGAFLRKAQVSCVSRDELW